MAMKAAGYCILVTPTGDDDQTQKGQLIVVHNDAPQRKTFRGVVEHVGKFVQDDIEVGNVVHYAAYRELPKDGGEKADVWHVVPHQDLIAIED